MTPNVERWRLLVLSELERQKVPLPADLVLSHIHAESRGAPGLVNQKSGASGLLQVMPATLDWYNEQNPTIPLSALRSKAGAAQQIRVGLWVLAHFWRSAYKYLRERLETIPTEELAKIAALFYVAGPGATKKKLDKVQIPFYAQVAERFPSWNALPYPPNIFKQLGAPAWDLAGLSKWLEGAITRERVAKGGIALAMLLIIVAWQWLKKKDKDK